jgi:DNA-binding transcriptional MerR regulator
MRRHPAVNVEELQFGSHEVCQLAGVTPRQLQWWDEQKILSPLQQGHRRMYAAPNVIGMIVIAELRRKGLSLQKIRRTLPGIHREIERKLSELLNGGSQMYLLTDGLSVRFDDKPARIIDLLKHSRKPLTLISLSDAARRLTDSPAAAQRRKGRGADQLKLF